MRHATALFAFVLSFLLVSINLTHSLEPDERAEAGTISPVSEKSRGDPRCLGMAVPEDPTAWAKDEHDYNPPYPPMLDPRTHRFVLYHYVYPV